MFNKVVKDDSTIDYYLQSPQNDAIHMHVVYDENYFIKFTYVSFLDEEMINKIYNHHGILESEEYNGVYGLYLAVNRVVNFITDNAYLGYTDFDIAMFSKQVYKDINELKRKCEISVNNEGFFKSSKQINNYKREYMNE